jgi:hypothetical protein
VAVGRRDPFGLAQRLRECGPVLHRGRGDDRGDQDIGRVDEDVPFGTIDFLRAVEPRGPVTGDALTLGESTTAAVGRLRRPERVRTSPRTVVRIRAQVPLRQQRRKCL